MRSVHAFARRRRAGDCLGGQGFLKIDIEGYGPSRCRDTTHGVGEESSGDLYQGSSLHLVQSSCVWLERR